MGIPDQGVTLVTELNNLVAEPLFRNTIHANNSGEIQSGPQKG